MDQKVSKWIAKGDEAFLNDRCRDAMELYFKAATQLYFNPDPNFPAESTMQKSIVCYHKINESFLVDSDIELREQYFSTIRYWQDHSKTANLKEVENEIYRHIPIEPCENREEEYDEGSTFHQSDQIGPYTLSISSAQGIRNQMEDAHFYTELRLNEHQIQLFCVLDGHGGSSCSKYLAEYFPTIIKDQLNTLSNINDLDFYNALFRSCIFADDQWKHLPFQEAVFPDTSGSTAVLACIIDNETLWVANVGDSGAAIEENGKAVQLSESAKPTIQKYYEEILTRGGIVKYGRVDGSLDMARSIGDIHHPSVSARPTIKKHVIDKSANHLIIACDGLWDVIDAQLALDSIKGMDPVQASEHLRKLAYCRGSTDNVTILVVSLH